MLIRLRRADVAFLNGTGNGARHLESILKLREIVRANLPELRSMVKWAASSTPAESEARLTLRASWRSRLVLSLVRAIPFQD